MAQGATAPELLNEFMCECEASVCGDDCTCVVNYQLCTTVCDCGGMSDVDLATCTNPFTTEVLGSDESDRSIHSYGSRPPVVKYSCIRVIYETKLSLCVVKDYNAYQML
ncbi:hypothetical protein ScPMuIL_014336 [Solemya velum]